MVELFIVLSLLLDFILNYLSCLVIVCKFKSHRHCVFDVVKNCKWTTRSNIENDGADILSDVKK